MRKLFALTLLTAVFSQFILSQDVNAFYPDSVLEKNAFYPENLSIMSAGVAPFSVPAYERYNGIYQEFGNVSKPVLNYSLNSPLVSWENVPFDISMGRNLYGQYSINDISWISTSRSQREYIGLGAVNAAGAMYNILLGDYVVLSAGIYAGKYMLNNGFYNNNQFNDAGFKGNLKISIHDNVNMHIFGQYSLNNTQTHLTGMYQQTNYGGAFEFKVNNKWGVMMGVEREYDIFRRKWITYPVIFPVFYSK